RIGERGDVRDQLPEPIIREPTADFEEDVTQLPVQCLVEPGVGRVDHGSVSPTVGYWETSWSSRSASTSTVIGTPGNSSAARAARVTPSLMTSRPSLYRVTRTGGIPSIESPCSAFCRASLYGSAPLHRDVGR